MSSESPAPVPRRGRFGRTVAIALGALLVAVLGLSAANSVRPPRVTGVELNGQAAIERTGQRLQLRLDQPVTALEASQVELVPAAPFELSQEGALLTLRLGAPLAPATEYRVELRGLHGTATGARGDADAGIRTPAASLVLLQRGPDGDRVVRQEVGGETTTLLEAPRLQEAAVSGRDVAAVELDAQDQGRVVIQSLDGEGRTAIELPDPGSATMLRGAGSSGMVGWTYSSAPGVEPIVARLLYTYDTTDPAGVATPVEGLGGEPLSVLDWTFVPGTSSIVAQADDESMLLVDPSGQTPPTPLGAHSELRGFLPGTTSLVVADPDRGSVVDLASGETRTLELPDAELPVGTQRGRILALDETSYLELVAEVGDDGLSPTTSIIRVDDAGTRQLYAPAAEGTRIAALCLDPGGHLLAVTTISAEGQPDGYPNLPGSTATTTIVLDAASGALLESTAGAEPSWCG
ncbi:hypothetical protein [Homoserinibacter sp. YIM 151385]|uniref:hypothetical protein n=1 Tax=Homoserinibacter sp. YIM 151385 TaxID=2985506 RepID=UPI0022EFD944|nr:hypothetical protein [Homoserinibacter sp. YIM 151385]WBU37942.1 hypothetical protein OF852_13660 [Homoserinibacter sp. YIM 151385]